MTESKKIPNCYRCNEELDVFLNHDSHFVMMSHKLLTCYKCIKIIMLYEEMAQGNIENSSLLNIKSNLKKLESKNIREYLSLRDDLLNKIKYVY